MNPDELMKLQARMEQKRKYVWNELKGYEDSLAMCIKDMAVDITGGPYLESVQMANQLAWHLCVLFSAHQKNHSLFEEYKPHHYHYHQQHHLQIQQGIYLFCYIKKKKRKKRKDDYYIIITIVITFNYL